MTFQPEALATFQAPGAGMFSPMMQPPAAPARHEHEEQLPAGKVDGRLELPLEELSYHRLTTPAEIGQIMHLRGEIQLPAAALADPAFHTREKKETSVG